MYAPLPSQCKGQITVCSCRQLLVFVVAKMHRLEFFGLCLKAQLGSSFKIFTGRVCHVQVVVGARGVINTRPNASKFISY